MAQLNPTATNPQTSKFWFLLLKTVGAVTLLLGAITGLIKATEKPHEAATITFSGRVHDDADKAIQGAVVIASIDQSVGQTKRSDTNGQFQVQVPAAAQSLRLVVSADGYTTQTTEAQIHRTGPEEIDLHLLPQQKPPAPTVAVATPPQRPTAIPSTKAPAPAQPAAPGGIIKGPVAPTGPCTVIQNGGSGNVASPTCNPDPMAITRQYFCEGEALVKDPRGTALGSFSEEEGFFSEYANMAKLGNDKDYSGLLAACTKARKTHPEWATPALVCAEANRGLGKMTDAISDLKVYQANKHNLVSQPEPTACDKGEESLRQTLMLP